MIKKVSFIFILIKAFVVVITTITIVYSCTEKSPFNQFKGKGEVISNKITVNKFKSIKVYDDITLELNNDSSDNQLIEICGGKNLLPNIKVESKDGVLSIRNLNKFKWINNYESGIKVIVSSFQIKEIVMCDAACVKTSTPIFCDSLFFKAIDASGVANISVHCNFLHIYSPLGMSDIVLSGSAKSFYSYNGDMGFINASGLQCEYAHIHDFGINKMYAPQTHQLGVTIENIGDVYYSGNPTILWTDYKSKGRLIYFQ